VTSRGAFAFIEFAEEADAIDALKYMDGTELMGRRIMVKPPGDRKPKLDGPPKPGGPTRQPYGYRVEIDVRTNERLSSKGGRKCRKDYAALRAAQFILLQSADIPSL